MALDYFKFDTMVEKKFSWPKILRPAIFYQLCF